MVVSHTSYRWDMRSVTVTVVGTGLSEPSSILYKAVCFSLGKAWIYLFLTCNLLWEPYPSYHNGLFSPLLVQRFRCQKSRSISVLSEQYETSYLFNVTLSFLCNIICYLISVFAFSLVTLSGATTQPWINNWIYWAVYPYHSNRSSRRKTNSLPLKNWPCITSCE